MGAGRLSGVVATSGESLATGVVLGGGATEVIAEDVGIERLVLVITTAMGVTVLHVVQVVNVRRIEHGGVVFLGFRAAVRVLHGVFDGSSR